MKPYKSPYHVPFSGLLLLVTAGALAGLLIGFLAHYLSTLIYYLVVFPIVIGMAAGYVFKRLVQFCKVRHAWLTALLGAGMGLVVALAFYATPYWGLRRQVTEDMHTRYPGSTSQDAIAALQDWLQEETGSIGLLGYMKLQANYGQNIDNALLVNGVPITFLNLSLKSGWAWAYWLLETLLLVIPVAFFGYLPGEELFNESANDWYGPARTLATAPAGSQDALLSALQDGQAAAAGGLLVKGEEVPHPRLELDIQRAKRRKADILLVVKVTTRSPNGNIRRRQVSAWEASPAQYGLLVANLQNPLDRPSQAGQPA